MGRWKVYKDILLFSNGKSSMLRITRRLDYWREGFTINKEKLQKNGNNYRYLKRSLKQLNE